jgi:hypothetical protein
MSKISDGHGLPFVPGKDFMIPVEPFTTLEDAKNRALTMNYLGRLLRREVFMQTVDTEISSKNELANVHLSECYSCNGLTIWHHDSIIYPPRRYEIEPNPDLCEGIREDFNEARTILDLSPRGAAALLRLCVQKLCIQLGKPGKNIDNDIASLVRDGLSIRVQQALDVVRVIGNEAVHPGRIDLKDDHNTAAALFDLVNRIAYDTITHPKELNEIYQKLPEAKRDAITKRDSATH